MLTLKKLSKIYTKEGNVNTALHDIDLHFARGEFVVITGKSGSGKSTLLNVLSGLESYEQGEMYVEGHPTSHYTKEEKEKFNFDYISTIYQDYNILESFTVLENVEFALTSIEDLAERRAKALAIIERVGMTDRLKAKGSTLSGGEKQRTVIARAIAKDSPIILADEPTGNLDSDTAKDVLDLIKEISDGKLVIMVTHDYDDVKEYATRHIVMRDGEVETDEMLGDNVRPSEEIGTRDKYDFGDAHEYIFASHSRKDSATTNKSTPHDTFMLGVKRYASRPRQAVLMSVLLTVALVIALLVMGFVVPKKHESSFNSYVNNMDGRVMLINNDESCYDEARAEALRAKVGATHYILQDSVLDQKFHVERDVDNNPIYEGWHFDFDSEVKEGKAPVYGEVALRMPYTYKGEFNIGDYVTLNFKDYERASVNIRVKVSGFSYYVDNNKNGMSVMLTPELFNAYTRLLNSEIFLSIGSDAVPDIKNVSVDIDFGLDTYDIRLSGRQTNLKQKYTLHIGDETHALNPKNIVSNYYGNSNEFVVSPKLIDMLPAVTVSSRQISLFFDDAAKKDTFIAGEKAGEYRTVDMEHYSVTNAAMDWQYIFGIMGTVAVVIILMVTIGIILVLALQRLIYATRSDIAIFRTMGISSKVVKRSTYVHLTLAILPAYIVLIILSLLLYFTPMGQMFTYIGVWGALILLLMSLLLVLVVAVRYNKVLYREKISKNLRRVNK